MVSGDLRPQGSEGRLPRTTIIPFRPTVEQTKKPTTEPKVAITPESIQTLMTALIEGLSTIYIPLSYLDTDGTLAANSDVKIATQKATKTYADTKVPSSYLDTDGTLAANSDVKIATQKATKTYADAVASTAANNLTNAINEAYPLKGSFSSGSDTVSNTTTETDFSSSHSIPADTLVTDDVCLLKARGVYKTDGGAAPTIQLRLKLDNVTILDTTAITLPALGSFEGWEAEFQVHCVSTGISGELEIQGAVTFADVSGDAIHLIPFNTDVYVADTTADLLFTVSVEWGTADADNSITMRQFAFFQYHDSV